MHASEWLSPVLLVGAAALSQPLSRRLPVAMPATTVQVISGLILGPTLLGALRIDAPVRLLSGLGMSYLLFVTGIELQQGWRGLGADRLTLAGPAASWIVAGLLALVITEALRRRKLGIAVFVCLSATLVMPTVIGLAGRSEDFPRWVRQTVTAAAIGDLGAVAVAAVAVLTEHAVGTVSVLVLLITAVVLTPIIGRRRSAYKSIDPVAGSRRGPCCLDGCVDGHRRSRCACPPAWCRDRDRCHRRGDFVEREPWHEALMASNPSSARSDRPPRARAAVLRRGWSSHTSR